MGAIVMSVSAKNRLLCSMNSGRCSFRTRLGFMYPAAFASAAKWSFGVAVS